AARSSRAASPTTMGRTVRKTLSCAQAFATTSGPMPAGSPMVTATRGGGLRGSLALMQPQENAIVAEGPRLAEDARIVGTDGRAHRESGLQLALDQGRAQAQGI